MDDKLMDDIGHFFDVYQSRMDDILQTVPQHTQDETTLELLSLKKAVLARIKYAQSC